jgi:hypothetical protein
MGWVSGLMSCLPLMSEVKFVAKVSFKFKFWSLS